MKLALSLALKASTLVAVTIIGAPLFAVEYSTLKFDETHLSIIPQATFQAESLVVSGDESQLCWNGSSSDSKMPPQEIFHKRIDKPETEQILRKNKLNFLGLFTKCSFDPLNNLVTDELEYRPGAILWTTAGFLINQDWEPYGYHSTVSIYNNHGDGLTDRHQKIQEYDYQSFGISPFVLIEHPRISPDGKSLSFYLEKTGSKGGLYLHHFAAGTTLHLGNFSDKHPTFSPDGRRLHFHEQDFINKVEHARLGYYEIDGEGASARPAKRRLLTPPLSSVSDYIYEKHPTEHPSLKLIFFHGQESADGKKFIGVRSLEHPNIAFKLQLSLGGKKLNSAKHPTIAITDDSSLYFVGKMESEKTSKLFRLDYQALEFIKAAFQANTNGDLR